MTQAADELTSLPYSTQSSLPDILGPFLTTFLFKTWSKKKRSF